MLIKMNMLKIKNRINTKNKNAKIKNTKKI